MKIAVVAAFYTHKNSGMLTVDMSVIGFIRRHFPEAELTLYSFGKADLSAYDSGSLGYRHVSLQENFQDLREADRILYWGDFLHNIRYWEEALIPRALQHGISGSEQEARDLVYRLHSLEHEDAALLEKTVSFGTTIYNIGPKDLQNPRYVAALERIVGKSRACGFRDPISASHGSAFQPESRCLGIDGAFLLHDDDLAICPGYMPTSTKNHIGIFFGRTQRFDALMLFSHMIGHRLKMPLAWVPWLETRSRQRVAGMIGVRSAGSDSLPGSVFSYLRTCKFIITDTYHLTINAWRMGIPAICIGSSENKPSAMLNDKKKDILYQMIGANPFYVELGSITNMLRAKSRADRMAATISDTALADGVRGHIQRHRKRCEDMLVTALG
ncbi:polysaccharide pyruvyl transferase family protein [Xanthobacter sp. KR7-225]|uniref:polysaccharide pyruvyl transferase family protein n=1 Tax=Xanthobacter sp. KR7-225 TaxID=3156613 RepID=UPI0032B5C246